MGGNAVKHLGNVVRLKTKEFDELALDIIAVLSSDDIQLYPIQSYYSKEDHGDMDLIVQSDFWKSNTRESVKNKIDAIGYVQNGTVTSYAIPYDKDIFQVDIINVPFDKLEFAYNYFSWNDAGNLLGRVAHFAGFKLGHLGLQYILRDPSNSNHVVSDLTVTSDWARAIKFLGYNPNTYQNGFNALTDIFEYVMSNKLAHRDIFLLENRNNTSRTRDRKRKTYMTFLTWLDTQVATNKILDKESIREEYLKKAFMDFPLFKDAHYAAMSLFEKKKKVSEVLNGNFVNELIGISGEELGAFMSTFKEAYSIEDLYRMGNLKLVSKLFEFHDEWKLTSGY